MACAAAIKTKNDRENRKRGYEGQMKDHYPDEKLQRIIGPIQRNEKILSQMVVVEATKKMQEKYLQLHFIPYLQSDGIPVFESYLLRSNTVVKMSQQLPHLNFHIGEGPKSYYMSGFSDTGYGSNIVNIDYHQSSEERHPNLVSKFSFLKDLDDVDPFNISGLDGGKEIEKGKGEVDFTAVITYKTPFVVYGKLVTASLAILEGVACNTIF